MCLCVYACNNNNLRKSRRGHWRNGRWGKKNGNVVNTVLIYEILKNLSNKKSDCKHQIELVEIMYSKGMINFMNILF